MAINFSLKNSITALILAGGKSSRMGQDKALIPLKGSSFIQQICLVAQDCASEVYVITPWVERYQSILPEGCQLIREIVPIGQTKSHGPLIGFAQGLTQVKTEWILLLACDLPNLKAQEIQQWMTYLTTISSETIALLPRQQKGWEPLCGFYHRRCLTSLQQFIYQGGKSFQQWLARNPVQEIPINNAQILFNCNTQEDLKLSKC